MRKFKETDSIEQFFAWVDSIWYQEKINAIHGHTIVSGQNTTNVPIVPAPDGTTDNVDVVPLYVLKQRYTRRVNHRQLHKFDTKETIKTIGLHRGSRELFIMENL